MVYWLRLHTADAGSMGSIPAWRTKISHAVQHGQRFKKKKKRERAEGEKTQPFLSKYRVGSVNPVEILRTEKSSMGATRHTW